MYLILPKEFGVSRGIGYRVPGTGYRERRGAAGEEESRHII